MKKKVLSLVRDNYSGFAPILAQEKPEEEHHLKVSIETLRLWMIENFIWIPRKKKKQTYLPRQRKESFGELIQADGSHHRWFGDNHPMVNLNVFIDDATGSITSLYFSEQKALEGYRSVLLNSCLNNTLL